MVMEMDIDGSIVSLHLRNFLCHDNLEIKFNRNVNFIVGRNGSGKSAILTALVVGLGSRASTTNRGSNLASFIKKGTNSATIEIKIKNNSPKAYKPDIYGDYITIVRNITPTTPSYKIKSTTGEVKSTKFEDVNSIILSHNIQVNNPISVLNQDDARSFYATDAKKKYVLFSRATNLDKSEINYKFAIETCDQALFELKKKEHVLLEFKEEYNKWKTYYEQLQSHEHIEQTKQKLQNEYYWSEIAELEEGAAKIQAWLHKKNDYIERQKEELRKTDLNFDNNKTNMLALNEQLEETLKQKREMNQKLRLLEQDVNETQKSLSNVNNSKVRNIVSLNKENQKIEDLSQAIQNIQSGSAEVQRAELEVHAAQAKEAAKVARARYNTAEHEAEQTRLARAQAATKEESAVRNVRRHRETVANLKQQLRELESRRNDSLAVYGRHMSDLCDRIRSMPEGYFTAPPKGPIGAYLRIKERRWGGALEHIIGGNIHSFCVNTAEDAQKLFKIMESVYGNANKPSVTCSRFLPHVHNVSRTSVRTQDYTSALDALDISDPVVANFLIDNIGMESILLVPEQGDAMALSSREQNVPKNCSKIVTLDSAEFHPAPNYRSYGGDNRQIKFLHVSIAERKTQLMMERLEKETELQVLETEAKELSRLTQQARQQETTADRALQTLLTQMNDKNEQERNANEALKQRQAPQFDALVGDLNTSKENRDRLELQRKDLLDTEKEYNEKIIAINMNMSAVDNEIRALANTSNEIRDQIESIETTQQQRLNTRKKLENDVRETEAKMREVVVKLGEKQTVIDTKINSALKLCPRIESPRPLADVENELNKISMNLKSMQPEGLTKLEVMEKYLEVRRKYKTAESEMANVNKLITQTKATAENHLKYSLKVQMEIIRRVQHTYQAMMNVRGYSGVLEIKSGSREVKMSGGRHGSSTNSLSGGERTYATVSFILALWECVELPFYFMDEFDVWMDKVNRKTVLDLLIDHALKNSSRQYVFLTPQDTPSVTAGPQISLHVLENPRP